MNAKEALAQIALKIDKSVEQIIKDEQKRVSKISPIIDNVIESFPVVSFGGKRLRGAFLYYSYLMHNGKNIEEIMKATGAIELLHSYLLAHDDVIDKSDIRHRKPTVHKIFKNQVKSKIPGYRDTQHFGEGVAICVGDILCHIGLEVITNLQFKSENKLEALRTINIEFADTGYGQVIDFFGEVTQDVDEEYVMLVHNYKTGKYTYETPLHVGAILAGADEKDLKALSAYALPAGIAFQLQDDILGMYGDEYRIGKPADSDLKEGKKTLLIVKALEMGTPKQKKILESLLGNPHIKAADLEVARKIITDTGSLEYSKKTALRLVKKAKVKLNEMSNPKWNPVGKAFLEGVADYMINRDL